MTRVGIGYCAYISNPRHSDLAKETLESIRSDNHEIVFCGVVNHVPYQEDWEYLSSKGELIVNPENNVSMGWNKSMNYLLDNGCDYVIIPNLDIVFKANMVDKLVAFADAHKEFILWTALPWNDLASLEEAIELEGWPETPHFSCFMVDARLREIVGEFDTNFKPAYNEDIDMHWRIVLSGNKAVGYEGARFFHHGSGTIKNDDLLMRRNNATHAANDRYFVEKWGAKPATAADPFLTFEMYRTPFDK